MATITANFTGTTAGQAIGVRHLDSFTYAISGTFSATVVLEKSTNAGLTFAPIKSFTATQSSTTFLVENPNSGFALFRFRCSVFVSGTVVTTLADVDSSIGNKTVTNADGTVIFDVTEGGVVEQAVKVSGLGAGILHSDSSGNQTSSPIVAGDATLSAGNIFVGDSTNKNAAVATGSTSASKVRARVGSFTFTVTIATPGVFSKTAHGLLNGDVVVLSTTGALPTGLAIATPYFVIAKATDTFELSATYNGSAITTSGTQSGTHTATYSGLALAPLSVGTADIAAAAAIDYSKLSLAGSIANADLAGSIAYSKLSLTGAILNADLAGSIAPTKLAPITDGSSPSAGQMFEKISSTVSSATSVGTSAQYWDATSITLTAGRWLVQGAISFIANGATFGSSDLEAGIGTTTGNSNAGLVEGDNWVESTGAPTSSADLTLVTPMWFVSVSGSTIYYLKGTAVYTVATPKYKCNMKAFRLP